MFGYRLAKWLTCLTLTITLTLVSLNPGQQIASVYAAGVLKNSRENHPTAISADPSLNWRQVDASLINAVRNAHDSTEVFASSELDNWVDELMKKVDDKFLSWYFSYGNQKAMEFGIPFAWLAFAGDYSFNVLRKPDEQRLHPNQVLQTKMIEDFQNKFGELVLNPESAQASLEKITERVGRNHTSALGMQLATIKSAYKIPDEEWEEHLNDLASIIYDTGSSRSTLSAEDMSSNLAANLLIKSTVGIGGKFALNFAAKVKFLFFLPDVPPVGGTTINSPAAVCSNLQSGLA